MFVLSIADVLLTDGQKAAAERWAIWLWNFTDDFKARSTLAILRSTWAKFCLFALGVVPAIVLNEGRWDDAMAFLLIFASVLSAISIGALSWSQRAPGNFKLFGRVIASLVVKISTVIAVASSVYTEPIGLYGIGMNPAALVIAATFFAFIPVATILLIPIALIFILRIALTSSEFLFRQIAQYPKGPIIAASGLVGAVAALLKAFK